MSDSPVLREAKDYAGPWQVEGAGDPCPLMLKPDRIETANAHALTDAGGCLPRLLGQPAVGWRPATDGIDMVGPDRLSVGFFAFQGDGSAVLTRDGGKSYRLVRVR